MAQSRSYGKRGLYPHRNWNPARWDNHPSYNVAKKVVDFEYQEEIPRARLRAAYGDGFQGAPLRCQSSSEGAFPLDAGTCDGATTQAHATISPEAEASQIRGARHV